MNQHTSDRKTKIVVIPTYNEIENINNLFDVLLSIEPSLNILIVDDNSPDGTSEAVRKRMVLAANAVLKYPKKNRLVIDAGTCITYDFIDENDNYIGGAISPGISLRYRSLNDYTSKLPLLEKVVPENFIGNSTELSIHVGVIKGVINEIDGFIDHYSSKYANFVIILTGGDTDFLAMQLKNTIFANSNFLLEGLQEIFQYNQENV
jgi:type III pantothenate kinase